uniref:Putative ovule protein n=1 Tax=Solanum chacoense TaxID=4108 RepID=A0A0V0HWE3_SOLCH
MNKNCRENRENSKAPSSPDCLFSWKVIRGKTCIKSLLNELAGLIIIWSWNELTDLIVIWSSKYGITYNFRRSC